MENTEIIYICNSINNKNVRANELKILEKHPEELYFIFGENDINTKKRYYKDLQTLNEDYNELLKIKNSLSKKNNKNINKKSSVIVNEENYKSYIVDDETYESNLSKKKLSDK